MEKDDLGSRSALISECKHYRACGIFWCAKTLGASRVPLCKIMRFEAAPFSSLDNTWIGNLLEKSALMLWWLSMRTHNTGVVSSNPGPVTNKSTIDEEGNEEPLHKIHFPRKCSKPCVWILLHSKSSMQRRYAFNLTWPLQVITFYQIELFE